MVPGMTSTFAAPGRVSLFPEFESKALRGLDSNDVSDGVMLALYPDPETAKALAVDGGSPVEELHVTVCYPGKVADVELEPLLYAADMIANREPITATIGGHGRFTGGEDGDVLVALVDSPALEDLRRDVLDALAAQGVPVVRNHGYTPHVTLAYLDPDDASPVDRLDPVTVTFTGLAVVYGEDRTDVPFSAAPAPTSGLAAMVTGAKMYGGSQTPTGGAVTVPALGATETEEPHAFKPDPNTRRCATCGGLRGNVQHTEEKAAFKGAAAPFGKGGIGGGKGDDAGPKLATGAFVALGGKKGRVDMVVTSGTVPGAKSKSDEPVEGSKDSPAARVVLYEASGAGTWKSTGKKVAAKVATLKRIPPLRTREGKSLEENLAGMVIDFTEDGAGVTPSAATLRTVYQRGAASWPGEAKTLLTAEQWGLGRAEAFLATVAGARPEGYVGDDDLLPI